MKKLVTLAKGDPHKLAGFLQTSGNLRSKFGFGPALALETVFSGKSFGFDAGQIEEFGSFRRFSMDVRPFMKASAGMQAAFGAKGAHFANPDITMAALLAAAEASEVEPSVIATAAMAAAQAVKNLGGNPEELLAAMAPIIAGSKTTETAVTGIGRFADVVERDPRFKGVGLLGAVDLAAGLSERELKKLIGENVQAKRGFGLQKENRAAVAAVLESILSAEAAVGTERSLLAGTARVVRGHRGLAIQGMAQSAASAADLAEEKALSAAQNLRNIQADTLRQIRVAQGTSENVLANINDWLDQKAANLFGVIPDEGSVRRLSLLRGVDDDRLDAILGTFIDAVERFHQGSVNMEAAAGRLGQVDPDRDVD